MSVAVKNNSGSGDNGAGAAANSDPLFGNDSGASGANSAGANSSAGAAAAGASGGTAVPGQGAAAVVIPSNWKESLPPEYKDAGWLKNIADIPALVKSHASVQNMIGAEKIPVPPKNADAATWKNVFQKLGLPEKVEDYKVDIDPKFKDQIDPDFLGVFGQKAHSAGILPTQAKQMAEWFAEVNTAQFQAQEKAANDASEAEIAGLKKEWGAAYNENVNKAKLALKEFAGEAGSKYVRESGMGRDVNFIKLMAKVGETLQEDVIKGDGTGSASGASVYSPSQAREMINTYKNDLKGAYYNKDHPDHESAKKKVSALYGMAFPKEA